MLSQPVVDLLAALGTGSKKEFYKVMGAADFMAAAEDLKGTKNKRVAYVIPLADKAEKNSLVRPGVSQRVTELFGVVMAIEGLRDVRGDAVNAEIEAKRKTVINALQGFVPEDGYEPVQYAGGRLLKFDQNIKVIFWQLEFSTAYLERKV